MARPTPALITALHRVIERLDEGAPYQWGHMGSCNCGHLAQELTQLDRATIHKAALQRAGDWGQQAIDYCPSSGYPLDHILDKMFEAGLSRRDVDMLERLADPKVLRRIPMPRRHQLRRNRRDDVVLYMREMADYLEEQWIAMGGDAVVNLSAPRAAARQKNERQRSPGRAHAPEADPQVA